jgi:DNA-binding transcriptional regulator YiaG
MRSTKSKLQADRPGSTGLRSARHPASSRVVAPPRIGGASAKRIAVSFRDLMAARSAEERLALLRAGNIPAGLIQEAGEELQIPTTTLAVALGIPRSTLHQWTADNGTLPNAPAETAMRLRERMLVDRRAEIPIEDRESI